MRDDSEEEEVCLLNNEGGAELDDFAGKRGRVNRARSVGGNSCEVGGHCETRDDQTDNQ